MMNSIKILILLLFPVAAFAQVKFDTAGFAQLQAKAKAETYTDKPLGGVLTGQFIAAKFQLDKTAKDSANIRSHYADADFISKTYSVTAYPTFLFFNPEGKLVHRACGYLDAADFIELAKDATDPHRQYYTLLENYRAGRLQPGDKPYLAMAAGGNGNEALATEVAESYMNDDLPKLKIYTPGILRFLAAFSSSSQSRGFRYFLNNAETADSVMQQAHYAEDITDRMITKENIDDYSQISWPACRDSITKKYNATIADRVITRAQLYRDYGKDWPAFCSALIHYTDTYEDRKDLNLLDKNARMILENSNDKDCLQAVLRWSRQTLVAEPANAAYRSTYTLIQQKLAIKHEN
jgi:hypothetical protein